jgi:hypothetical protein
MERPLTEEEKLRQQIPLSDDDLAMWLDVHEIPFERDGAGIPWLSNSTLQFVYDNLFLKRA